MLRLCLFFPDLSLMMLIKRMLVKKTACIGSSAAMKVYWIGIARQYFLFNLRQNSVAGLACEPVLSAK